MSKRTFKTGEWVQEQIPIKIDEDGNIVAKDSTSTAIDASTVTGNTVETSVPANAVFTDTETTTTLSIDNNILKYIDEVGNETTIDLSLYLDDTNLARITDGIINTDGVVTFKRDDDSTFTLDLSSLLDTQVVVNDTLTSDSVTEALSANQGRVLHTNFTKFFKMSKWQSMMSGGGNITWSSDYKLSTSERFIYIPTNASNGHINIDLSELFIDTWRIAYIDLTDSQLGETDLSFTEDDVIVEKYNEYTQTDSPNRLVIGYHNSDTHEIVLSNGKTIPAGITLQKAAKPAYGDDSGKALDSVNLGGHSSSYFATESSVTNKNSLKIQNNNEINISNGFNVDNGKVYLNYRGANRPIAQLIISNGRASAGLVRLSNIAYGTEDSDAITLKQYKELKQGSAYNSLQDILDKNGWIGSGRYKIVNSEGRPSEVFCVKDDDTGNIYMVVGKFADGAHDTVAGTIPTRDIVIDNVSGTVFNSNFGEQICQEVRFVGVTNIEGDWKSGRQLDFSHLIPTNRKWKHTFTSGQESGMPRVERNGYVVTGMHNYLNNWQNDKTSFHRISDTNPSITAQAFVQEGSFYLNGAQDAKFTIAYDVDQVGQDAYVSAGFGRDDNHRFSFEDNQTNTRNIGTSKIDFSTSVYVLIR